MHSGLMEMLTNSGDAKGLIVTLAPHPSIITASSAY